jgi:hypothetical protein
MTEAQMRSTAASQIDLEIGQSVAPIQSQINSTQARETAALGQIGGMFDNLQPVVQQGATAVTQSYEQATSQEQAVFANAQAAIQSQRGNRAAEAQAMSQKIGGPVAISDWTKPYDQASQDLTYLGAGQQLHTLAYAQAGEQQAQQFAGQVFPLIRTEQMASARNQFEEQIREYEEQITALKSQKGAQVNKRYNELRTQELQYGLQRAQFQLDKLDKQRTYNLQVKEAKELKRQNDIDNKLDRQQMNHTIHKDRNDYLLQKQVIGNDKRKTDLLEKDQDLKYEQFLLDKGIATGTVDGKKTIQQKTLEAQIQRDADLLDLSKQELREKKHEFAVNTANQKKTLEASKSAEWVDLLENAVNPQPGKTYTETVQQEVTKKQALGGFGVEPIEGVYTKMVDGKLHYYVDKTVTHTVPNNFKPLREPNRLVDYMVTAMNDPKYDREWAVKLIKAKFPDLEGWEYGKEWPPKSVKDKIKKHGGDSKIGTEFDPFDLPDWMGKTPLIMQEPTPPTGGTANEPGQYAKAPGGGYAKAPSGKTYDKSKDPPLSGGAITQGIFVKTKYGNWYDPRTNKYVEDPTT